MTSFLVQSMYYFDHGYDYGGIRSSCINNLIQCDLLQVKVTVFGRAGNVEQISETMFLYRFENLILYC